MINDFERPLIPGKVLKIKDYYAIMGMLIILLLIYALPIYTIYYFADEIGQLLTERPWKWVITTVPAQGLIHGRPITFFFYNIFGNIATGSLLGLQFIRVMQFFASFVTAMFLYYLLRKRLVPILWAAVLILFIWSQPAIQVFHGYASLLPYFLGIIASYLALYLLFWTRSTTGRARITRFILAILLLLIGWLTFQATPFAALSLVSFYALTAKVDDARAENKKLFHFIAALSLSMVIYLFAYRTVVRISAADTYDLTTRAFSFISGGLSGADYLKLFDIRNYLGLFEWWNYLLPIPKLSPTQFYLATGISAALCLIIFIWSFFLELARQPRRYVQIKYLLAAIAIMLTLSPIVADDFSGRQHIYFAAVSAIILAVGYSLSIISQRYLLWENHRKWIIFCALPILIFVLFGARANLNRGLVLPGSRFYTFVSTEIINQAGEPYDRVLVVTTPHSHYCSYEPCRAFFGRRLATAWRDGPDSTIFYTHMLARLGLPDDVPIEFTPTLDGPIDTKNALIINNQKLFEHFQKDPPF